MKERKTMVLELASILQKLLLNLACIPSHTSRSAFFPLLTSTILYSTAAVPAQNAASRCYGLHEAGRAKFARRDSARNEACLNCFRNRLLPAIPSPACDHRLHIVSPGIFDSNGSADDLIKAILCIVQLLASPYLGPHKFFESQSDMVLRACAWCRMHKKCPGGHSFIKLMVRRFMRNKRKLSSSCQRWGCIHYVSKYAMTN